MQLYPGQRVLQPLPAPEEPAQQRQEQMLGLAQAIHFARPDRRSANRSSQVATRNSSLASPENEGRRP